MLADPAKMLVAPGVYDGLTARIALREGFDCELDLGVGGLWCRGEDLELCVLPRGSAVLDPAFVPGAESYAMHLS